MSEAAPPLDVEKVQSFVANAHGDLDAVRAALDGIPLVEHARAGGEEAKAMLELLEASQVAG